MLERFTVDDLVAFSTDLRSMGAEAETMCEVSQEIADHLLTNLVDEAGRPACISVTLHKTHVFDRLPIHLRDVAVEADPSVAPRTACLALLARADTGELPPPEPAERVRPLTPSAFEDQPIFVRLLAALGVDEASVLDPEKALAMRMQHRELNVYVEPELATSDLIDDEAREMVRQLGIHSIVAIGGILPSGDLFLVALIARVPVGERVADLLRSLGTAAKVSLIPFTFKAFPEG